MLDWAIFLLLKKTETKSFVRKKFLVVYFLSSLERRYRKIKARVKNVVIISIMRSVWKNSSTPIAFRLKLSVHTLRIIVFKV